MNISHILKQRYSTKVFDPTKKISPADVQQIKDMLRLAPSSTNAQPWHFIITDTEAGKQRMAQGTQGHGKINEPRVLNASHVLLVCAKTDIDDAYVQRLVDQEEADGRIPNAEIKEKVAWVKQYYANLHKYHLKSAQHWMEKQVYISLGMLLLGVAALGIDALPMEGIDLQALDQEFDLNAKGYTSLCMVALGYRGEGDFNETTPKSRFPESEVFTVL